MHVLTMCLSSNRESTGVTKMGLQSDASAGCTPSSTVAELLHFEQIGQALQVGQWGCKYGAPSLRNHAGRPSSHVTVGLRRSSMRNISISVTKQYGNEAVCLTGGISYLLSVDTVA